jgi:hypothetical protein
VSPELQSDRQIECPLGIVEPRDAQLDAHHLGGRLRHQQIELVGAERLFGPGAPDPRAMGLLVNGVADIALLERQLGPTLTPFMLEALRRREVARARAAARSRRAGQNDVYRPWCLIGRNRLQKIDDEER